MYDLSDYAEMIADHVRMDAYALALKSAIKPDSVVLDIGTGPGIHAFLAAKFGARKVYAIEPNDCIHLAKELSQENGFLDRIEFIQNVSTRVTLPERVDVIVSDIRGSLPMYGKHIPAIVDARERHLKPDGVLIPQRDTMWAALVEKRSVYMDTVRAWSRPYGLSMERARQIALNSWSDFYSDPIRPRNLLTEPRDWFALEYRSIENPDVGNTFIEGCAVRDGTAHGWLIWFDTELIEGIGFSNGPASEKISEVYGRGFFPLLEPVKVKDGDKISLEIDVRLLGEAYEWNWRTVVRSGEIKADFDQSTAVADQLINDSIAAAVMEQTPVPGSEGEMMCFILTQMKGSATIRQIADEVIQAYPARFRCESDAVRYIHSLAQQLQTSV